jgi:hypothetical protein
MQLTRFDRWLRERYVYETHIKTLRAAKSIPKGIRAEALPDVPGVRYKYLYIARHNKSADAFIASLRAANLMFFTSVVDRKSWYVPWIAPKQKSLTWFLAWIVLGSISTFYVIVYLVNLLGQPEVRQMLSEALETLKG